MISSTVDYIPSPFRHIAPPELQRTQEVLVEIHRVLAALGIQLRLLDQLYALDDRVVHPENAVTSFAAPMTQVVSLLQAADFTVPLRQRFGRFKG